jgi:transcriptional regulator with XRE-family HTH domain
MKHAYVDPKKTVGINVRKLRRQLDLTQDALSTRCGIYRSYLSRIESGSANPTLLTLVSLASVLNVTIQDLFDVVECTEDVAKHP